MSLSYEIKYLSEATRLVGTYLHHWANMELRLNALIGKALRLEPVAEAIICANLKFTDKIHIAKTTVSIAPLLADDDRTAFTKRLNQIKTESATRNMLAHNAFGPLDRETLTVEFLVTKAKGDLKFPDVHWTEEMFHEKFRWLVDASDMLGEMCEKVAIIPRNSLANALLQFAPTPDTEPLRMVGLLSPSLEDQMSETNSPTDPIDAQTSPSSQN